MADIALTPLPAGEPDLASVPASRLRRVVADAPHAFPCRRCLRDAAPGDALVLLPYDPFRGDSPYRQPGPIYLHVDACTPGAVLPEDAVLPDQLTRRRLSVRAFDADHLMRDTAVIDGHDLAGLAAQWLDDPAVGYLHVHNAGPGCFAVRIDRRAAGTPSPR